MQKTIVALLLVGFQAHAAIPARPAARECRERRPVETGSALLSQPADQSSWDCLDLSRLGKTDLISIADKARDLDISLSKSVLSRSEYIEVSNAAPEKMILEIDSARFNRRDIIELRRANVRTRILSAAASLNINDLLEIAQGDGPPVTVELNGPTFTTAEVRTMSKQPNLRFVIDLPKAAIDEADANSIVAEVHETKITF